MRTRVLRIPRPVIALTLACALPAGCGSDSADPTPEPAAPLTVAVARGDGYLVPFARWDSGAWTGPESVAGGGTLEPDGAPREAPWFEPHLDGLRHWTVAAPLDAASTARDPAPAATPGAPVDVRTYCQAAWMLERSGPAEPTPETTMAAAIVGVAFSREVDVTPAAELSPNDDERARALDAIRPAFETAESAEVARRDALDSYQPRLVGAARATTPLAITRLYRVAGGSGVTLYAFEAARSYPAESQYGRCDETTVMSGWLAEDAEGRLSVLPGSEGVQLTNCDRKGSPVVRPLGAVVLDARTWVAVVNYGYEGESYAIHELSAVGSREALNVHGGGC